MNRRLWHLEMALVVTLGVWAGPLAAKAPQAPPTAVPGAPVMQFAVPAGQTPQLIMADPQQPGSGVVQVYAVVPVIPHPSSPPGYEPGQEPPPNGPVRR